jgi:hypothetical protein
MGRRLFAVADVFRLAQRPETVLIAADCSERAAPPLLVGQWLEFRNPSGGVTRAVVSGVEFLDPPNPDRPFGFPVRPNPPGAPVEVGAEVWALAE